MWGLTEPEQSEIMEAVQAVVRPYWTTKVVENSYVWQNEDGSLEPRSARVTCLRDDTPDTIRALADVYDLIIEKGASFLGDL